MNILLKKFYTGTFSIIFGLFISIIPNVLNESCALGLNANSVISIIIMIIGFGVSSFLGDIKGNVEKIKRIFKKVKRIEDSSNESSKKVKE